MYSGSGPVFAADTRAKGSRRSAGEDGLSDEERLLASAGRLLVWYKREKRDLPWRRNRDAYRVWISEIMLQQTRVEAAKPYFYRFMEHFPTLLSLAEAKEEELLKCWEGLGYYSRARNLKKAAELVRDTYNGVLPASREKLLSLPGIGSYTAGAIASIAYGIAAPAVDGNVLRVLSRLTADREDILKPATKKRYETLIGAALQTLEGQEGRLPYEAGGSLAGDFNQALIEVGALVCIPGGEPRCGECPLSTLCKARAQGVIGELPVKTPKKQRKIEEKTVLLLEYKDKIAIRKRKEDGLLASLYEFINLPGKMDAESVADLFKIREGIEPLPEAKHVFSHTEWHMSGYLLSLRAFPGPAFEKLAGKPIFVSWDEARERYPIPSAFLAYKKFLDERYGGISL
ncbi:MAG: A/G-specific adenine glycosylase [Lachnospiraceae bacterium]|nr:A/G-specific adenine glycosylase [Lachnospiraceae bacterium]